jgi:hypothetical protein
VYIHATGGLGNQLFQYNFAHLASSLLGEKVTILFEDSSTHEFPRGNEISEIAKHCTHNISIKKNSKILFLVRIFDSIRYRTGLADRSQREKEFINQLLFSKKSFQDRPPFIVQGASQDWRLVNLGFSLFKDEIAHWLASIDLGEAAESICREKFQLMHIRRGDYSLNPDSWGLLSLEYYKQTIDNELRTIIVTDDLEVVNDLHQNFPSAKIFSPAELDQLQTIKLMSLSTKITVANSSFSWWGARFAHEHSGAESIFPDRWFKNSDAPPNLIGDPSNSYNKAIFE